jgi:hypothetical protein
VVREGEDKVGAVSGGNPSVHGRRVSDGGASHKTALAAATDESPVNLSGAREAARCLVVALDLKAGALLISLSYNLSAVVNAKRLIEFNVLRSTEGRNNRRWVMSV